MSCVTSLRKHEDIPEVTGTMIRRFLLRTADGSLYAGDVHLAAATNSIMFLVQETVFPWPEVDVGLAMERTHEGRWPRVGHSPLPTPCFAHLTSFSD